VSSEPIVVPRGRHAPPLEVRREVQLERLFAAAATIFARGGYAEASAEAISREAGMSKATFYEHFANKEECLLALFDRARDEALGAIRAAVEAAPPEPHARVRAGVSALLAIVALRPEAARTLLVEVVGAGPAAQARRDGVLEAFADFLVRESEADARRGAVAAFSPDEAYAVVGAIVELISRQLRTGRPERIEDLEPVIERLVFAMLPPAG